MARKPRKVSAAARAYQSSIQEPETGATLNEAGVTTAWQWYSRACSVKKEGVNYLLDYLKEADEELHDHVKKLSWTKFKTTTCWTARLLSRKNVLPVETLTKFKETLEELRSLEIEDAEGNEPRTRRDNSGEFLALVDWYIDETSRTEDAATIRSWLTSNSFSALKIGMIKKQIEEYIAAGKADLAYVLEDDKKLGLNPKTSRKFEISNLATMVKLLEPLLTLLGAEQNQKKAMRKPRKRKVVEAAKKAEKVQYLEMDSTTGLKSITPDRIVGSTMVVLYETKQKKLCIVHAEQGKTLDIKGQTMIVNADMKKSIFKRMSKPEIVVSIANAGKRDMKRIFDDARNEPIVMATTVTNNNTLILKVF